ncbi:MAG: hypothetical protein KDK70_24735, partial [Myxococcales bacterium]|nr:hypothetical protein [Myxococcales bacterium]
MIDDVLRELQAVGKVESEGEFTLDRGKAREKMRRFQLADPRAYVLELVQAASLKGATKIRFDVDSRDMRMEFNGRPFTTEDFDDIYGAAFSRRLDHDVLARRQLALGVNSAMALRPTRITVESGNGRTGARLELEPDADDTFEVVQTQRIGTLVHVRERFRLGTFVAFFKNLAGTLAEEQLLRERCGYASLEIDLEGTRLDRGLAVPELEGFEVLEPVRLQTEHTWVAAVLGRDREGPAWVDIVKDGVYLSTHRLPEGRFTAGFRAVVQDHALRKDVSQADVVRDEAYDRMLWVLEQALHTALARVGERLEAGHAPSWAESELMRHALRLAEQGALLSPDEPTGLAAVLRRLPLWHTTQEGTVTLEALQAEVERHGSLPYVIRNRFEGVLPPKRAFVIYFAGHEGHPKVALQVLEAAFEGKPDEVSGALGLALARERARRTWRARPMEPALPVGAYLVRRPVEGPGLRGELGIAALPAEKARVGVVVDGCLLCEHEFELPVLALRLVITADAFVPDLSYGAVVPNKEACAAVLRALESLPALYGALAGHPPDGWAGACAMSFLEATLRGEPLAQRVTEALGFPPSALEAALREVEVVPPSLGLEQDSPHPVATMALYPTLGTRRYSLVELFERARRNERMLVVSKAVPEIEADILVIGEDHVEAIEHLFPREFEDGRSEVARLTWRRDFMNRLEYATSLQQGAPSDAVVVPIEGKDIEGQLRVAPRSGYPLSQRSVDVLHEGRALDTVEVLMAGSCEGWVTSSAVHPKADYSGVKQGAGLDAVRGAVLRAWAQACLQIAQRAQRSTPLSSDERGFLREVLALVFPTRPFRSAYDKIARDKDVPPATQAKIYCWLYAAIQTTDDATELDRRLWRLTQSKSVVADAMAIPVRKRAVRWALTAVDVLFPPTGQLAAFEERALRPAAPLDALPLLQRHDGRFVSVEVLRPESGQRRIVLHVEQVERMEQVDLGSRLALVVDAVHLDHLRRMLGGNLLNGAGVIERERNRTKLAAQAPVQEVALGSGVALAWVSLPGPAVTGQVGLRREHPADPHLRPSIVLVSYQKRRRLGERTAGDRALNLVAAVDDARFNLTFDAAGVREDRIVDDVLTRCEQQGPQLIAQLLPRLGRLPQGERTSAWYHVLDFLLSRRPSEPARWLDESSPQDTIAAAARLPGFATMGGPRVSLVQLVEAHAAHGGLEAAPPFVQGWDEAPYGPRRPVVCVAPSAYQALRTLGPSVERPPRSVWGQRARAWKAAKPASPLAPGDDLVSLELPGPLLQGWLSMPVLGSQLGIDLCLGRRILTSRVFEGL